MTQKNKNTKNGSSGKTASLSKKKMNKKVENRLLWISLLCTLAAAILICLAALLFTGGFTSDRKDDSTFGNTVVNTANGGHVLDVAKDTYYCNNGIFVKPADDDAYMICEDLSQSLSYYDGWLYYCNMDDNNCGYRIKTDGTGKEKLTEFNIEFINIVNDTVYFISNKDFENRGIYTMSPDGGSIKRISEKYVSMMFAYGGWLYYIDKDKDNRLYRMSYDCADTERLTDSSVYFAVINEENLKLYYSTSTAVYRSGLSGSSRVKIKNTSASRLAFCDGRLFYIKYSMATNSEENGIYSMTLSGLDTKRLRDDSVTVLSIGNGKLYFKSISQGFVMMRSELDGSETYIIAGGEGTTLFDMIS